MFGRQSALADDLAKVRARLDEVEARLRARDLEYEELLDKVHRWMQRTSARVRKEAAEAAVESDRAPDDGIDPVSRALLQRRGTRNGFRPPEEEG